ncbi:MFS transporter [Streptomyces sp. SID10815]|uniref:MFS transporter n=1 Tax=Streptomyces sp. SID10815 TaxID=2706027 RepID=UPI0031BB7531
MRGVLDRTLASLAVRNFRLFAGGQLVSVAGTWMMVVAQDWLVLSLTDDSAGALGAVTALQFAPLLLLTLHAGGLADRHDKRRLLTAANLVSGVCAAALAALVLTDGVRLWHVFVFALLLGSVNAVEVPARMAFVSELVGADLLPNASALSAAYFNLARVLGPAAAGLLVAWWGTGPVMLVNAVSYLATVAGLRMIRPAELHRAAVRPRRARVRAGVRHLLDRRDLLPPMALVAVTGMIGYNFQLTLPLLARTVFDTDAAAFGLLTAAFAAGSLLAAFATTARRGRPPLRLVTGAALALGVFQALAGLAPGFPTALALLCAVGFASVYFAQAANHHIQLGTDPAFRGRVMALYTLLFQGTTPVGALLTGAVAGAYGVRWAMVGAGVLCALAAVVAPAAARRRGGLPGTACAPEPEAEPSAPPRIPDGS